MGSACHRTPAATATPGGKRSALPEWCTSTHHFVRPQWSCTLLPTTEWTLNGRRLLRPCLRATTACACRRVCMPPTWLSTAVTSASYRRHHGLHGRPTHSRPRSLPSAPSPTLSRPRPQTRRHHGRGLDTGVPSHGLTDRRLGAWSASSQCVAGDSKPTVPARVWVSLPHEQGLQSSPVGPAPWL
jgi:hypothetical protein